MRILVVGGGGREHALCWAISASSLCESLYCAPGNAGISKIAECIDIQANNIEGIVGFSLEFSIDFVVIGPEVSLVLGLVDELEKLGIKAFGPTAGAAKLEGSKGFMKDLCVKYNIPTAAYERFYDSKSAKKYIEEIGAPIVVKEDGLAAGKGVTIAYSIEEALLAIENIFSNNQSLSPNGLVVEEFLTGQELSYFVLVDGINALPLAGAQDHKKVGDRDTGPNTGGMGAYSPTPILSDELESKIMKTIILPTVEGMALEGTPFKGVLYAGLMLTSEGPKLLEYKVRFGYPECQVLMMRLRSDILPALLATNQGTLDNFSLRWSQDAALTIVMAAKGYPGKYKTGEKIVGLESIKANEALIFHAATKSKSGQLVSNGGRVLNICSSGKEIKDAQKKAYSAIKKIEWEGGFYRNDIGWRAISES